MRPIALGRKNHLFAGSDEGGRHWAVHASLIETAKIDVSRPASPYLADVLAKIRRAAIPMSRRRRTAFLWPTSKTAAERSRWF